MSAEPRVLRLALEPAVQGAGTSGFISHVALLVVRLCSGLRRAVQLRQKKKLVDME
jgi:hypothetical protein